MLVTKTSIMTGETRTQEINVTQEQIDAWVDGELIQDAMPHLTADEREFLMTGMTPDDWEMLSTE